MYQPDASICVKSMRLKELEDNFMQGGGRRLMGGTECKIDEHKKKKGILSLL